MSLILRQLMRDPARATRPLSRALARRWDDDFWALDDVWPTKRARRLAPVEYTTPLSVVEDMNRQVMTAMNRMNDLVEDLEHFDSLVDRLDRGRINGRGVKRQREESVRRLEDGALQLALDVSDFKPEELKIKLVDNSLVVEAQSEHSGKDSYRKSHFKRWFKLPEDCKVDEIKSKLTEDNQLLIDLPTTKPVEQAKTRQIPIEREKPSIEGNKESKEAASNK